MRVIIQGNWAPYVGTDYCDALGIYDSLEAAETDAHCYAWERWEAPEEESGLEDEGPDYWVEEYDPYKHDMLRVGGNSFAEEFEAMEK
jgi:hypothetical protein